MGGKALERPVRGVVEPGPDLALDQVAPPVDVGGRVEAAALDDLEVEDRGFGTVEAELEQTQPGVGVERVPPAAAVQPGLGVMARAVGVPGDRVQQQEQAVAVPGELDGVGSRRGPVTGAVLELTQREEQVPGGLALGFHGGSNLNARDILPQGKSLACWCV